MDVAAFLAKKTLKTGNKVLQSIGVAMNLYSVSLIFDFEAQHRLFRKRHCQCRDDASLSIPSPAGMGLGRC